jgi:cystathionine gamma-synthase
MFPRLTVLTIAVSIAAMSTFRPETAAATALHWLDPNNGSLVPPIVTSTAYARDSDYALRNDRGYSRDRNPTGEPAEAVIAALEHGAAAMLFPSGMAAATAVFRTLAAPGDHIIAPRKGYFTLRNWLVRFAAQWQVDVELIDTDDIGKVEAALRPGKTRIVWLESPANPTMEITDIETVAALAHRAGATVAVDNTAPSPVLTQPLLLGADLVMHSATKFLGGHGDVLAGALVTRQCDDNWQRLRDYRYSDGACLGPFEAWLLQRSLRTLHVRVRQANSNASAIAEHLQRYRELTVLYPGLADSPGHAIAAKQMQGGFGALVSIQLGTQQRALAVLPKLQLFAKATSFGSVESLAEHRFTVEGPNGGSPDDLIRLSIGIEAVDDLLADLDSALHNVGLQ